MKIHGPVATFKFLSGFELLLHLFGIDAPLEGRVDGDEHLTWGEFPRCVFSGANGGIYSVMNQAVQRVQDATRMLGPEVLVTP